MFRKDQPQRPIEERWSERELFFWTAFKWVQLIAMVALTVYLIVSLIGGNDPAPSWLRVP